MPKSENGSSNVIREGSLDPLWNISKLKLAVMLGFAGGEASTGAAATPGVLEKLANSGTTAAAGGGEGAAAEKLPKSSRDSITGGCNG